MKDRIAIIGGGLAGTACAFVLAQRGFAPVIFEASDSLAAGASGNSAGIFNPRLSAGWTAESEFYAMAYDLGVQTFPELACSHPIDFHQHGSLYLADSDERKKKLRGVLSAWKGREGHIQGLSTEHATAVAGLRVNSEGLFLPHSGSVSPAALCAAYAHGLPVRLGTPVNRIISLEDGWIVDGEDFDSVILACGLGVKWVDATRWLPVESVRGQIVHIAQTEDTQDVRCNICYGGYIAPAQNGAHVVGASFERGAMHSNVSESDTVEILTHLHKALPEAGETFTPAGARAGLRTAAQDHFPIIGAVPDLGAWQAGTPRDLAGLYVTTAHGSYGLVSSLAGAHIIADKISTPTAPDTALTQALSPARFLHRAARRGHLGQIGQ